MAPSHQRTDWLHRLQVAQVVEGEVEMRNDNTAESAIDHEPGEMVVEISECATNVANL
jgi:hypothetical protein